MRCPRRSRRPPLAALIPLALLGTLLLAACGGARAPAQSPVSAQYLNPDGPTTRPFSSAVRVGNMLYLSGQIGTLPNGTLIPGGIEAETRQTMENIRGVLERSGSSLDRVVKCTVMLADMREWGAMNTVYASFFPTHKPARSSLGVNGLALSARVEIECWATVG